MKKLLKEFEEFALKGNMLDLAVGVIIGGAFNGIIGSLVEDVIMPVLSLVTGKIDFTNLFVSLNGQHYTTLAEAKAAGAATLNYGTFLTNLINFLIMAFVVFMVVKELNQLSKKSAPPAPAAPKAKVCPFCKSSIDINASRCPHCTSVLIEAEEAAATAAKA